MICLSILLLKINVPKDEAECVAETIKERNMAGLFDHFEDIDIQVERKKNKQEREAIEQEREEMNQEREEMNQERGILKKEKLQICQSYVELYREKGISKDVMKEKLVRKFPDLESDIDKYINDTSQ